MKYAVIERVGKGVVKILSVHETFDLANNKSVARSLQGVRAVGNHIKKGVIARTEDLL